MYSVGVELEITISKPWELQIVLLWQIRKSQMLLQLKEPLSEDWGACLCRSHEYLQFSGSLRRHGGYFGRGTSLPWYPSSAYGDELHPVGRKLWGGGKQILVLNYRCKMVGLFPGLPWYIDWFVFTRTLPLAVYKLQATSWVRDVKDSRCCSLGRTQDNYVITNPLERNLPSGLERTYLVWGIIPLPTSNPHDTVDAEKKTREVWDHG